MEDKNKDRKYLYDALTNKGVNLGSYEEYNRNIDDPDKAKWLYNSLSGQGINLGSYEEYMSHIGHSNVADGGVNAGGAGIIGSAGRGNVLTGDTSRLAGSVNPVTGQVYGGGNIATQRGETPVSAGNIDLDREKREDEEKALRDERRKYFEETGQIQRVEQIRDEAQKRLDENPNRLSWADRALGLTNIYHGTLNAWKDFKGLFLDEDMAADRRTVKNAEKIMDSIDEAGHSDNGWLDRQVGGTLRGVADSATDSDTWDFGLGGVSEGLAVKRVIEKQQRGENLSASEQGLMTMLGLKTYVDNSYGGDLSMGYRVGQSLPESAGFMVQMYLNPLSGLGKKTGEYFGKAAIKHFARQGMKKGLENGLITGTKIVGRVGGDIVEQLGTTLIPGAGRVMEDALNRDNGDAGFYLDANGDVQYDGHFGGEMTGDGSYLDGKEPETERGVLGVSWRSFGKALGSNFIENWSEAVGEYFGPVSKGIGSVAKKGVEKLNSQKLNKLYDWVMNTKSSDFMTAMDKFKKRTKYDGLIGEYMEEVVGNMTNAATVGDNNFSMDPDSEDWQNSVFNPEMNAETFLSCALMSGTMRAVEGGVNYGQRRYLNGRVSKWEDRAAELLGDDWGEVKRRVDNSEPGELAVWLNDLRRQADEVTDKKRKQGIYEQIKAVHNYAFYRSELQAFNARRVMDEEEMTPEQKVAEREEELRGQAEDVSESRVGLNNARSELDGVNSQLRVTLEEMLDSGSTDGEINNVVDTLGDAEKSLARSFVNAWKASKRAEDNSVEIQQQREEESYENERLARRRDYRDYKMAMYQATSILGQETATNIAMSKDKEEVDRLTAHLRPDEQRAAQALWQSSQRVRPMFGEMDNGVRQVEESARQTAEREFTAKGHESGEMIQVMINGSDEPVYVTSGALAFGQDDEGKTVVIPSQSDDMIIYADKNGDMKQATPSDIKEFVGSQTREDYVNGAVERAKSEAMGRFEAELESPDLPAPSVGVTVTNPSNGRMYVINSRENGVINAVRLTEDGSFIDDNNPDEMKLSDADYYGMKAKELWKEFETPSVEEGESSSSGAVSSDAASSDASTSAVNGSPSSVSSPSDELPKLEDGTTDFDALFDKSVGRFYEEYAKEFGTEEANMAVLSKRDSYYKQAEKIRKQAEKSGSFNERVSLLRQAKELEKRGDEVGRIIGKSKNKSKESASPITRLPQNGSVGADGSTASPTAVGSTANNTVTNPSEGISGADATGSDAMAAGSGQAYAGQSDVPSLKNRRKGRFLKQDSQLSPASTAREMAARAIATGALTLKWSDDKGSRGLGAHTFNSESERRKRLWAFDNTEGLTPEMAAHALWQDMPEAMQQRYTDQDVFNEIVDLMTSYDSPTAMWQSEVLPNHTVEMGEEGAPGYAENEERMRMEWEAEQNGLSVEDWQSYNEYVAEQSGSLHSQEEIDNEITLNLNNYDDRRTETEVPAVDAGQIAQATGVDLGAGERSNQPGAALERGAEGAQGGVLEGDAMVRQGDAETGGTGVRTAERGGQGDLENPSGRQQGTMETESINVTLSDEKDNNGIQFVLSKDGEENFGFINDAQAIGISTNVAAPIRLSYGNEGYGYVHMQKHVDQLKENGYDSVEDFVKDVASGKNEIRQGNVYFNESTGEAKETFLLVKKGKKGSVLYVELVPNGEYYTVNSGGVFKNSYIEKRKELWSASTEHSAASGEPQDFPLTQQNPESGNVSALSQSTSSADKVSASSGEMQENSQEKRSISAEKANVGQFSDEEIDYLLNGFKQEVEKNYSNYKKEAEHNMDDFQASISGASDEELEDIYNRATGAVSVDEAASVLNNALRSGEISRSESDLEQLGKTAEDLASAYAMRDFIQVIEDERKRRGLQRDNEQGHQVDARRDSGTQLTGLEQDGEKGGNNNNEIIRNNGSNEKLADNKSSDNNPSDKSSAVKRSKWVDEEDQERYAELKRRLRAKLGGQINFGVDPEIFMLGVEMSYLVIKHGARQFVPYAKVMLEELGEAVRPYLRVIYSGTRYFDGMEPYRDEMTPSEELDKIDVDSIGKNPSMMEIVENAAKEQEAKEQIGDVEQKVKSMKPKTPSRRKKDSPVQGDLFDFGAENASENANERANERTTAKMNESSQGGLTDGTKENKKPSEQKEPNHRFYLAWEGDNVELRRYTIMPNGTPIYDARPVARAESAKDMLDILDNPKNRFGDDFADIRKVLADVIDAENHAKEKRESKKDNQSTQSVVVKLEQPETWVGRTFFTNGMKLKCTSVENGYAQFDNLDTFMGMGFDVPTVQRYLRRGEWGVVDEGKESSSSSAEKVTESSENIQVKTEENSEEDVTLHQRTRVESAFSNEVAKRMRSALTSGEKPFRSIVDLRKLAAECGMNVDSEGRDDILIQELVEDALTLVGRELAEKARRSAVFKRGSSFFQKELFEQICLLYDMQPTISQRSSNRIKMQQYSTPLPMSFVADMFVAEKGKVTGGDTVLEPTAGNGMLVFAVPTALLHVNELDDVRYENLRFGGYKEVTKLDATKPFEGGKKYAGIISNPPFGKAEPKLYDGVEIANLEAQIALNALESMKDDGRAAIIVGGNMEYSPNGAIKGADRALYSYLYDHYNVKGVVDMDGSLYRKQGTTYPTRIILIEGRRSEEERAQERVYPPTKENAIPRADNFDSLYDIVNGLLNSKEKTNGTAVLRREQGLGPDSESRPRKGNDRPDHQQPQTDDRERGGVERGGTQLSGGLQQGRPSVLGERGRDSGAGGTGRGADESRLGTERNAGGGVLAQDDKRVGNGTPGQRRVGLTPSTGNKKQTTGGEQPTGEQQTTGSEQTAGGEKATSGKQSATSGEGVAVVERKRTLTDEKSAYRPHSKAFSLESVAPAAMTDAMDDALKRIENEVGDIDTFVQTELGYDSVESLHNALAAEQVDSVAMAIYQMKRGEAMIIGDQTGVGKGRQMAALIRWAVRQGKKPIFITQKADLFSDLYRDLVDIGSGDLRPFIFNSDGDIKDAKNQTVYKPLSDIKMREALKGDKLPEGYDFVVLTYSQLNKGDSQSKLEAYEQAKKSGKRVQKKKDDNINSLSPKPDFLRKLSKDNILLLDESHTAAGDGNTGMYLQSITRGVQAVTFASATFAKRPDTMPLYAIRTAMSKANVEADKLIQIIEKGGVTLQEIMSRALSAVGQMVRRERDMSDVKTEWKTVDDPSTVEKARRNYDKTVQAFNAIIKFQKEFVDPYIENLSAVLASQMKSASKTRGTDKMGINNVPFASKAYNYTKQLLLALKVDAIVDEVEREIQAGRHPVIALESTMESVLDGYNPGDVLGNSTFGASLMKGLENTLTYSIKDEKNKEVKHKIPLDILPASAKAAYEEVKRLIIESTTDVFVSPIDDIISKLNARGYSVGELTGRDKYVSMEDGRAVVKKRADKDKKRMTMDFNSGKTDVLILNKSASTGISLHASKRFSDQRQRTMVMAQPLSDINDYMQMIGRIDRTGQVHRGYYINLGLPVPAENRFMMMLSTKLKSLNANTTTSQDSKQSDVEAPDLLNKYGSQVIVEYLRDHPALHEKMGSPLNLKENQSLEDYVPQEDDARKVTGYVALLSVQEQEAFYSEVVERYNTLISYLNETDSNDLKISVMPLKAKTISKKIASKGNESGGLNPFAQDSYVEQVEMDVLRKPYKIDEVKKLYDQLNKGLRPGAYVERVLNQLHEESAAKVADENARFEQEMAGLEHEVELRTEKIRQQKKLSDEEKKKAIDEERTKLIERKNKLHGRNLDTIDANAKKIESALARFNIGSPYLIPDVLGTDTFTCSSPGLLVGFKMREDGITPSTSFAVFAVLDGRRRIEVKLSDTKALDAIRNHTIQNYDRAQMVSMNNWDSQIPQTTRANGYILTGNIIQAFNDSQGKEGGFAGKLVSYTDVDGNIHDGILMPQSWNPMLMKNAGVPINARQAAIEKGDVVTSTDGFVRVERPSRWSNYYILSVPKSKKQGGAYYLNEELLKLAGYEGFYQRGLVMRAEIKGEERLKEVLDILSKMGVRVSDGTDAETGDVKMQRVIGGRLVADEVADRELRDILVKRLSDAGIEVVMDAEEVQRVLDEANGSARMQAKKRALETASVTSKEAHQPTVVSSADGAKVRNNLDGTKEKYENTTGLAERQEVNGNDIRYFRRGNGEVYGFVKGGRIYIDPERVNAETPIHEYAHLWAYAMRRMNPKEWANIVELMKESPVWEEVKQYYPELESDEEIADEVLATYSGRLGAEKLREKQREVMAEKGNSLMEKVHAVAALERVKDALKRFWNGVAEFFNLHYTSAEEVADRVLYDLLDGVNPLDYGRDSLESVNRRFNDELDKLNDENAQNVIFEIGNPGYILRSAGLSDMPIRLYGNKLIKKMRKHGFEATDVKDLPKAINDPIAVFNNYGNEKNRAVLTELKTSQGNVLVTIEWGKGTDAEINIVTSVFGKGNSKIVDWINKGFATYINKSKALDYLRISAPIADAQDNRELSDAAKIVENFENPSVEGENVSGEEDLLFRVREEEAPERTGIGYKVFVLKGGQLYPPMVANPNGAATPVGVWLDADAAPVAGESKTGRKQVKAGGKGTQGGSGKLAYRPGWHLGEIPYALQFNRLNPETGEKELFPKDFVWAEVEYAADVDYQEEAMRYGYNANGKFQHSLAGLPKLPVNGSYKYRTNPNPETDEWVITGAMKVNRILKPSEVDEMVREAGREPQQRQEGAVTDAEVERLNESLFGDVMRDGDEAIDNETISFENDPISKLMGVSRYSTREQKAFAHRERGRMREQVKKMASAMGIEIDLIESGRGLSGKRARAKGWYDRRSGRIAIVLGNHGSVNDIMKTVLHEAVAHYGLRKLFGDHFDDFLDNVFANASSDVKDRIIRLSRKHGLNMRTATEEYLAQLAEDDNIGDDSIWFGKIKRFFLRMLANAGVQLNIYLTDNELRYILWRSYENLVHPGHYKSVIDEVKDITMQAKLGARNHSRLDKERERLLKTGRTDSSRMVSEEDGDLYRESEEIADDFARSHKGAGECVAIRTESDLERYAYEHGYDGERLEALYEYFGKSNACYDYYNDKVLIFATDATEKSQNTYLWHENVHRAIDRLGLSDEEVNAVSESIIRMYPERCKKIESLYGEEVYREEIVAIWIQSQYYEYGDEGLLREISNLNGETRESLLSIYNYVKYGTREKDDRRGDVSERARGGEASQGAWNETSARGVRYGLSMRDAVSEGGSKKSSFKGAAKSASGGFFGRSAGAEALSHLSEVAAAAKYDMAVRSLGYHFQEAFQDCMLGLKKLQDILAKETGKPVQDYENAYMTENTLSSRNQQEAEVFSKHFFNPILDAMHRLIKRGMTEDGIYDYLMSKHAIERNREMAVRAFFSRDMENYKVKMADWAQRRDAIRQQSGLSWSEKQQKLDELAMTYGVTLNVDYSGLTDMYPTFSSYEGRKREAIRIVEEIERMYGPESAELLERVKLANQAILTKQRESGLMSRETFDQISGMYEYYVPLRGFDETTSDKVYDYINAPKSSFNAVLKRAEGRYSKADNPIAYIANMAESSIAQGNRNLMKQRFLLFVKSRPSDLVSISDLWLEKNQSGEWHVKLPDTINENDTPIQVQEKMAKFEEDMKSEMAKYPDKYVKASQHPDIPYRTVNNNLGQHQVIVKVNGKSVVLTINGNPRAAQAINGLMNPTADINPWVRRLESVNRWAAANFTRNNPSFIAVNLVRDAIYSNSTIAVKESPKYAMDYTINWAKTEAEIYGLVSRYKKGTLDMNDKVDKMFYDFIMNGGETGYNFIHDTDDIKGEISKKLKALDGAGFREALSALNDGVDTVNRWAEDVSRFAAYRTSIEHGRSVLRAVNDAKEVSVNFNRKGAGMKSGGSIGFLAQYCRGSFIFFNAGVQGLANFAKLGVKHPVKFMALGCSFMALGAFIPMISMAISAMVGGGGDDDDYWNIPEYVRRNNICIMLKDGKYATIPLPIELRALFGIGEMATSVFFGKEKFDPMKLAQQVSQILPVDFLEGKGDHIATNLAPTYFKPAIEVAMNESWTGLPIYKDTPYNQTRPEWTKVYKGTSPQLVDLCRLLSETTGGDKYKRGAVEINPAVIEHLFNGYFGGVGKTISQTVNSISMIWDEDMREVNNIPVAYRFLKEANERTRTAAINSRYINVYNDFNYLRSLARSYERGAQDRRNSAEEREGFALKYLDMIKSDDYRRMQQFFECDKALNSIKEYLTGDKNDELEAQYYMLKHQILSEFEKN